MCGSDTTEISSDSSIRRDLAISRALDSIMRVASPPSIMPHVSQTTGSSDRLRVSLKE